MGSCWHCGESVMNSLTLKSYARALIYLLAGLLVGIVLTYSLCNRKSASPHAKYAVEPGTEVFSVLGEEVMSLTYNTPKLTLTAQRTKAADRFAVQVTFADGRPPQQCLASPDLAGLLASFSTLIVKRQVRLELIATEFPKPLGTIEIRDRIDGERMSPMEFRSTSDKKTIAVSYDGQAFEVGTPLEAFTKLEAGCAVLAQR